MILRKINAALSLLTTLMLMDHSIFLSVWMLSQGTIEKSADNMPRILACLMVIHTVLSIILLIMNRKGAGKNKDNVYPKLNMATYVQRISGVLMILLLGVHAAGAATDFQPKILHAVLHPLFFAAVLTHVSVSVSKALVTLGIGNAKVIKAADIVMKVLCGLIFALSMVGLYAYLFMGVA